MTTRSLDRMQVRFRRTGARRYSVSVELPGQLTQAVDPAPGYDDDIPHDLVHYLVEAELGMTHGVFGSAAQGGGTFIGTTRGEASAREHARERRKRQKRERALRAEDEKHGGEMERSERLAGVCDLVWRRKRGQRPDPGRQAPELRPDSAEVERVVARLDSIAPLWRKLRFDGELVFEWPSVEPRVSY